MFRRGWPSSAWASCPWERSTSLPVNCACRDNCQPCVRILAAGREMTMDLGCVEFGAGGDSRRRYFLQLAGAGIDARAVELVSWALKKKTGPLAYVAAGLRAMRETQPLIAVEGPDPMSGQLVLVGNGRFYGGSFEFFPGASLRDGLLDVRVLSKVSAGRALRAALGLATGRVSRFLPMRHFRSPTVDPAQFKPRRLAIGRGVRGRTAGNVFGAAAGGARHCALTLVLNSCRATLYLIPMKYSGEARRAGLRLILLMLAAVAAIGLLGLALGWIGALARFMGGVALALAAVLTWLGSSLPSSLSISSAIPIPKHPPARAWSSPRGTAKWM